MSGGQRERRRGQGHLEAIISPAPELKMTSLCVIREELDIDDTRRLGREGLTPTLVE